jgi:hypothetical protein
VGEGSEGEHQHAAVGGEAVFLAGDFAGTTASA